MKQTLLRFFTPPVFHEQDKNDKMHLFYPILLAILFATLVFLPLALLFAPEISQRFLFASLATLFINALLLVLMRRGWVQPASIGLIGFFWCLFTGLAVTGGGVRAPSFVAGHLVLIILSGLLLGSRAGFVVTICSSVLGLGLTLLEINAVLTPDIQTLAPTGVWVISSLFFWVVVVLQHLAARIVQESTQRANLNELQYRSRDNILEAITLAADHFLKGPAWRANAPVMLEHLGRAMKASHAYIFEHHPGPDGEELTSMTFEWVAPGQMPDISNPDFQNSAIFSEGFERSYRIMSRGEPWVAGISTYTPSEAEYLLKQGIKALLEVPIFVGDKWWGTLGFDDYVQEREWSIAEIDALKIAANLMSTTIQRHRADTARETSEARFRAFMETSPAITIIKDQDSRYLYCNPQAEKLFGMTSNDIIGKTEYDLFPHAEAERFTASDLKVIKTRTPQVSEYASRTPDGETRNWWVLKFPLFDHDTPLVGIQILDITARTQAEQAREASLNLLTNVINALPDLIFLKDTNLRTILCNENFARALGKQVEEVYGHTDVENGWAPELVYGNPEKGIRGFQKDDLDALAGNVVLNPHEPANIEGEIRMFDTRKLPLWDASGKIIGVLGIARDVTERIQVEAEVRRLNAELEQRVLARTEELEAANRELEAFSYSISHDLRAPLRAINGFSSILLNEHRETLSLEGQHYLKRVYDGARRMGQLVDDLLAFSRLGRQELRKRPVQPLEIIAQVIEEIAEQYPIHLPEIILHNLPPCQADPHLLHQVYTNLISNAFKFTLKQPKPRIEIGTVPASTPTIYYIQDNGAGFNPIHADKLFGVFQRLHHQDEYEGTGIGLANVKRIITRHGGNIWAEAKPNEGATFFFTLAPGN